MLFISGTGSMSKLNTLALCYTQAGADVEIELVIHYQMLATKRKTEAVKVAVLPEVYHPIPPWIAYASITCNTPTFAPAPVISVTVQHVCHCNGAAFVQQ